MATALLTPELLIGLWPRSWLALQRSPGAQHSLIVRMQVDGQQLVASGVRTSELRT